MKNVTEHIRFSSRIIALLCVFLFHTSDLQAASPTRDNFIEQDQSSAVIFAYQQIGEDEFPDTSLRVEQFASQILTLRKENYNILSLDDIIRAYKQNKPLPPKSVAITFDGGYYSAYENAFPILLKHDIPFAVFVSTDNLNAPSRRFIGWDELKRLRRNKHVTIGLHTAAFTHMAEAPMAEIARQINNAKDEYRKHFKETPDYFAYPFGEYNRDFTSLVSKGGFKAAFGQQSGAAYNEAELFALPRFVMSENYGDPQRFSLTASVLPLPVSDIEPLDPHLNNAKPIIGFNITPALQDRIDDLRCFSSGQSSPEMQRIGNNRVELRLTEPFTSNRSRINCTMPVYTENKDEMRWRWLGFLFTVTPDQEQAYYASYPRTAGSQ